MWMMKFVIIQADTEVCPYGWMRLFIHYSFLAPSCYLWLSSNHLFP